MLIKKHTPIIIVTYLHAVCNSGIAGKKRFYQDKIDLIIYV